MRRRRSSPRELLEAVGARLVAPTPAVPGRRAGVVIDSPVWPAVAAAGATAISR